MRNYRVSAQLQGICAARVYLRLNLCVFLVCPFVGGRKCTSLMPGNLWEVLAPANFVKGKLPLMFFKSTSVCTALGGGGFSKAVGVITLGLVLLALPCSLLCHFISETKRPTVAWLMAYQTADKER